uniref:uncharacterized protein LOC122595871 n=1 Tax=Erigeron canadensis TaxID=72917 RepID=UPI001CB8F54A|nr:uncharacterized protein LOC122595871 [Erigeron canadensis]
MVPHFFSLFPSSLIHPWKSFVDEPMEELRANPFLIEEVVDEGSTYALAEALQENVMQQMGFPGRWLKWIRGILSSTRFVVLVNGSPTSEFNCERGVPQGDPLSPFIIIAMEAFSSVIQQASILGLIACIKLPNFGPTITHLLYADDAILSGTWSQTHLRIKDQPPQIMFLWHWLETTRNQPIHQHTQLPKRSFPHYLSWSYGSIGNGASIRFWIDRWIGDNPLCNTFPDLFKLERRKDCYIKDRCTGNGLFSQWEWDGTSSPVTPTELHQLQELLTQIQSCRLTGTDDTWRWTCKPSGIFTTKSMKNTLIKATHGPNHWIFPWNRLAPIKINIFGWKLEMNNLPTTDLLLQRNITIPSSTCLICNAGEEPSQHLLLDCPFTDMLWSFLLSWCKLPLRKHTVIKELLSFIKTRYSP